MRWAYRITSLALLGLALAPLLPIALRVALLVCAVVLAVVDRLAERPKPKRVVKVQPVVAKVGPPLYDHYEIKPPDPFPPTLGVGMFSAPRMRV